MFGSLFAGITGGDIFKGILGGLGSYSDAKMSKEMAKMQGEYQLKNTKLAAEEQRKSSQYETALADWMRMIDKERSRQALSNFSQFSNLEGYEPAHTPAPVGGMPTADAFNQAAGGGQQGAGGMGLADRFRQNATPHNAMRGF